MFKGRHRKLEGFVRVVLALVVLILSASPALSTPLRASAASAQQVAPGKAQQAQPDNPQTGKQSQAPLVTDTPTASATAVQTAILRAHILLQGRPAPPNVRWSVPVTLTLRDTVGGVLTHYAGSTDQSGYFTATLPAPGTYDWHIKNPQALANGGTATLPSGVTTVEMGTLREGDANNDNCVTSVDFSLFRNAFGSVPSSGNWDPRVDFNGDGVIGSQDFNP